jgi:hypothetical protein
VSARTVLVCNTCAAVEGLTPPADTYTTRRTLKAKGWVYWRRGVDYCPACAPAVIERNKRVGGGGSYY